MDTDFDPECLAEAYDKFKAAMDAGCDHLVSIANASVSWKIASEQKRRPTTRQIAPKKYQKRVVAEYNKLRNNFGYFVLFMAVFDEEEANRSGKSLPT